MKGGEKRWAATYLTADAKISSICYIFPPSLHVRMHNPRAPRVAHFPTHCPAKGDGHAVTLDLGPHLAIQYRVSHPIIHRGFSA